MSPRPPYHPPDHLGFELHYLAELCEREREAIDHDDDLSAAVARRRRLEFLEEHLLSWFDDFRSECLFYHSGRFYRGVLELTDVTLDAHVDFLRDLGVETGSEPQSETPNQSLPKMGSKRSQPAGIG